VNAGKHACAATVTVYLGLKDDQLILNIQDDGKGFKVSETAEGFGIVNIRQRVNHLGGSFLIQSMVGTGTSVELMVKTRRTKKERSGDR
jgi:signal transduction histidine kinase